MRWTQLPEFCEYPTGWEVVPLASKADFLAGQSPDSLYYNTRGDGVPFLQGNADFGADHPLPTVFCTKPTKLCKPGDTLISVRAPVGEINRADQTYGLGRGLGAVHGTKIEPDYLFHALTRWHLPLRRAAQGSTFEAITARHFRQLKCCLPISPAERRAIADCLNLVDSALRAANTELEYAKRMKTALLQQLLRKGLPGRHSSFKRTKIGLLPDQWDVPPFKEVADIEAGVTLNQDRAPRSNIYQYLTVVNVQRGCITIDELRYVELSETEVPKKLLQDGDIVVVEGHANSGEIGRAAMARTVHAGLSYQNHLFRIRPRTEKVIGEFLLYALNAEYARRHWNAVCNTSSGLNTINRRQLRRLLVPLPKRDEQEGILDLITAAESSIQASDLKKSGLERLRRSLRQNLLTGRLRLQVGQNTEREADRLLAEAVG